LIILGGGAIVILSIGAWGLYQYIMAGAPPAPLGIETWPVVTPVPEPGPPPSAFSAAESLIIFLLLAGTAGIWAIATLLALIAWLLWRRERFNGKEKGPIGMPAVSRSDSRYVS
jgi:hypothetical protein